MSAAKTWLWIILGFVGICVLSLVATAGAGVYFVSHHIAMQKTTSVEAIRTFDAARTRFSAAQPIIEVDSLERPREARPIAELPTSLVKPTDLLVLAWNPEEGHLAKVSLPFWLLRFGKRKIDFLNDSHGFNFERLNLDPTELERIGPALILDYGTPNGERVLIWTQ